MSKKSVAQQPPQFTHIEDPEVRRKALLAEMDRARPLTLDDVAITTTHPLQPDEYRRVVTGKDLARLLSFAEAGGNTDGGSVSYMLQGLSNLVRGDRDISAAGSFFIVNVLDGLAAQLESSSRVDAYRVALVERRNKKAVV